MRYTTMTVGGERGNAFTADDDAAATRHAESLGYYVLDVIDGEGVDEAIVVVAQVAPRRRKLSIKHDGSVVARTVRPCQCECNAGGFCGGCGHAGCGRR